MSLLYHVPEKAGPHTIPMFIGFVPRVPPVPTNFYNDFIRKLKTSSENQGV
jgi:hypothetical protein